MKRTCMLIGLCLAVLLLANPVLGEFYKYRDRNGVLRFTDNLADVPVDQRPDAQSYKEPDDYLTPYQKKERAEKARREAEMAANETKQGSFEVQQEERMNEMPARGEMPAFEEPTFETPEWVKEIEAQQEARMNEMPARGEMPVSVRAYLR